MKINVGDKLYTKKYIVTITELMDKNMVGISFESRTGNEYNNNIVSLKLIQDMIAQKEWLRHDSFSG